MSALFLLKLYLYIFEVHALYNHLEEWSHVYTTACNFFFMPRSSLHPSAVPLACYSFLLMLLILAHVMAHNVYIN